MGDVVVQLSKREAQVLLDVGNAWLCDGARSPLVTAAVSKLRAALDSPPVEEEQWQIVASNRYGEEVVVSRDEPQRDGDLRAYARSESVREAEEIQGEGKYRNPQVQSRTITTFPDGSSLTSPWTDLEEDDDAS